ncbi:MAG: hypothetical protein OEP95_09095 [Myxococcales bacterium]|nr:hypothetical protein [Myxococcales bacterium]
MMTASAIPRFNHVAMSLPADALSESGRSDLLAFYGEVFGWTEMPTMTVDRERLVLRCHSHEQFVFLHAADEPMRCGNHEHWGLSVDSPEALDALLARADKFREGDARVEIDERKTEDFTVLKLHSFYVRYLLPLVVEVQCYDWAEGFDDQTGS